jgi:hypothetical protein
LRPTEFAFRAPARTGRYAGEGGINAWANEIDGTVPEY